MAVKIVEAKLTTGYSWQDVSCKANWYVVRNINADWKEVLTTSRVGGLVRIQVEISENNWQSINDILLNWQNVKDKFNSWQSVKNY